MTEARTEAPAEVSAEALAEVRSGRRDVLVAVGVPVLVATLALLWSVLRLEFLSDDYVLCNLVDAQGKGADWSEIGAQLSDRWLYSNAYWRPVVNLVYGLNTELTGFTPLGLGTVNLLMHAVTVGATAWIAYTLAGRRGVGMAAGVLACVPLVMHPASVETVLWISARVTGVEVCLRMLTLALFLAHLRTPSRLRYGAVVLGCVLTLAAKESAVVLPVALLAMDLLDRVDRPWRERLRLHGPLVAVWIGYAAVRIGVLGSFVGSPVPDPSFDQLIEMTGEKLGRLFAPAGGGPWLQFLLGGWGVSLLLFGPRKGRLLRALVCVAWVGACLGPIYKTPLGNGYVGSRMLYGALPVVGLLAVTGLRADVRLLPRFAVALVAILLGFGLWGAGAVYARQFERAWQREREAAQSLVSIGADASLDQPVGLLSWPPSREVPGPIHPVAYFRLGTKPYSEEALPIVGMGALLESLPYAADAFENPGPLHALLDLGSPVVRYDEGREQLIAWRRTAAAGASPSVNGEELRFAEPRHALDFECLEVLTDESVPRGGITLITTLGNFGPPIAPAFAGGEVVDGKRRFLIDLTSSKPLFTLAMSEGRLLGVRAQAIGGEVRTLRALPRLPMLPAEVDSNVTRTVPFAGLESRLPRAPIVPHPAALELVLMAETIPIVVPCVAGEAVRLDTEQLEQLRVLAHAMKARRILGYFQSRAAAPGLPGAARSDVFRIALTDVPR